MDRFEVGMLVSSKAGHDAGQRYLIIDKDEQYLYLADGRIRKRSNPKKKKRKHVQLIKGIHSVDGMDDAAIKRLIKECFDGES